jgi:SnoaL-like protein
MSSNSNPQVSNADPTPLSEVEIASLRGVLDRQAITDCLHRYTRGLDRHDDELLLSAFHDDAVDDHGDGLFRGPPREFVAWANGLHESIAAAHQHLTMNIVIELDGDSAHAESYVIVVFRRSDKESVDVLGARFADRLTRRDGEWRIATRVALVEWGGTMDVNADMPPPGFEFPGRWDKTDASYVRPLSERPR